EQCWVWSNEGQEYFYDKSEWVRFRVEQEHWTDISPLAPSEEETTGVLERKSPYTITGQIRQHMIIAKHFTRVATQTLLGLRSATVIPSVSNSANRYLDYGKAVTGVREYALRALHLTMAVGDFYNGPQILATQIENLLIQNFQAFNIYLLRNARLMLDIALRAEIGWLSKEIIRYRAGDEKREDEDIHDELDARMAALVRRRRKSLRRMMRDIDRELLLFKTLSSDRPRATIASACFRKFMVLRLTYEREGEWLHYTKSYPRLVAKVGKKTHRHFAPNQCDDTSFNRHHQKAVKKIEPLFASGLSRSDYDVSESANGLEKKAAALQRAEHPSRIPMKI
ncbi:MAG: hypothetical protein Q9206_004575, partial [Seirophora lacunosa]